MSGILHIAGLGPGDDALVTPEVTEALAQATDVSEQTLQAARALGLRTRAYVAVAFDCPFEGAVPLDVVAALSRRMLDAGAQEIVIADTIGSASPGQVKQRLGTLTQCVPAQQLSVHFHDTRAMGVANAWAALEAGIRRFDASVGGIGGCPFAPGAAGNVATEDLVLMAGQSGFRCGVDINGLLDAIAFAEQLLQRRLGGRAITWLQRQRDKGVAALAV